MLLSNISSNVFNNNIDLLIRMSILRMHSIRIIFILFENKNVLCLKRHMEFYFLQLFYFTLCLYITHKMNNLYCFQNIAHFLFMLMKSIDRTDDKNKSTFCYTEIIASHLLYSCYFKICNAFEIETTIDIEVTLTRNAIELNIFCSPVFRVYLVLFSCCFSSFHCVFFSFSEIFVIA